MQLCWQNNKEKGKWLSCPWENERGGKRGRREEEEGIGEKRKGRGGEERGGRRIEQRWEG